MNRFELERKKQGFTLQELANKLGVDVSTIYTWENGRNQMRPKYFKILLAMGFDQKALIHPTEDV